MAQYGHQNFQLRERHYGHYDRYLTLYWYLNTLPDNAGGETNFPRAEEPDDFSYVEDRLRRWSC